MGNAFSNVSVFLVHTLFSLYILIVVLRFLLAWVRADFYNPLSQFLVTATNPLLVPLRRFVPSLGSIDTASIVLALGLKLVELWLLALIGGMAFNLPLMIVVAIFQLLELLIYVFIVSIIIQAIMSWVSPGMQYHQSPIGSILHSLNEPLLRPVRRVIPRVGMIDLSPLVVIIGLNVMLILLRSFYQH